MRTVNHPRDDFRASDFPLPTHKRYAAVSQGATIYVKGNLVAWQSVEQPGGNDAHNTAGSTSTVVSLSAGDVVWVMFYQTNSEGAPQSATGGFSGVRIGR